jgi:hypothetical protein
MCKLRYRIANREKRTYRDVLFVHALFATVSIKSGHVQDYCFQLERVGSHSCADVVRSAS